MAALPNNIPADLIRNTDEGSSEADYGSQSLNELLDPTGFEPTPLEPNLTTDGSVAKPDASANPSSPATDDTTASRLASFEDKFAEMSQRIMFLQGRLVEQQARPNQPATQTKDEPAAFSYDMDSLANEMQTNAPAALGKYAQAYLEHQLPQLREQILAEVRGDVGGEFAKRDNRAQRDQSMATEIGRIRSEYPEILSADGRTADPAFEKETNTELYHIIALHSPQVVQQVQAGNTNWASLAKPGDFYAASSATAAKWMRAGKYPKMKPTNERPTLREITQRVPRNEPTSNGRPGTSGSPKTIDAFFDSPKDRVIARRLQKQFGISEEAYVRQCAASQGLE